MPRPKHVPVPENARLERQPGEPAVQHRALLLLAMQDEGRRSLRCVGRALSRSDGCLRPWKAKYEWDARVEREGATAQARAVQIYREMYYPSIQMREIAVVEANMSVAFLVTSPPPSATTGVGDAARYENRRAEESPSPKDDDAKAEITSLRRSKSIVDALLGRFGQALVDDKAKKIVPNIRDLPMLIKARREIAEALGDAAPPTAGPAALEPSARLQEARRSGGSELVAMREDVEELVSILRALESSDRIDQENASVAKAPARLRAVNGVSEEDAVFGAEEAG